MLDKINYKALEIDKIYISVTMKSETLFNEYESLLTLNSSQKGQMVT